MPIEPLTCSGGIRPSTASRIAVNGLFPRGGVRGSLCQSQTFPADAWNGERRVCRLYLLFNPACNTTYLEDEQVTDRPIRVFHGTADDYVSIEPCRNYVQRLRQSQERHPTHGVRRSAPRLRQPLYSPIRSLPDAVTTSHCLREERSGGEIVNVETGRTVQLERPLRRKRRDGRLRSLSYKPKPRKRLKSFLDRRVPSLAG